jgi:two-component system NarL family response regulator
VLVVDHNPLLREGLSVLIRSQPDMMLVGVAADAAQALELFGEHRPDVTLMDLDLPDAAGLTAIEQIRKMAATACILGLLTYEWDEPSAKALRGGACECVAKDRLDSQFLNLIRRRCR